MPTTLRNRTHLLVLATIFGAFARVRERGSRTSLKLEFAFGVEQSRSRIVTDDRRRREEWSAAGGWQGRILPRRHCDHRRRDEGSQAPNAGAPADAPAASL